MVVAELGEGDAGIGYGSLEAGLAWTDIGCMNGCLERALDHARGWFLSLELQT